MNNCGGRLIFTTLAAGTKVEGAENKKNYNKSKNSEQEQEERT